ncbi:MAG TPA: CBS domain-containing protein [Polyangia bacterium]|nr:CBS domain-containing protein [Polyangia bacterium]
MLAKAGESFDPVVEVLMTPRPITVRPFETVGAAAAIMRTCRVRHLPVVAGNRPVGVLSARDAIAVAEHDLVGDVMTAPSQVVRASASVTQACETMLAHHYSCLPVVDRDALVGIFTATDALRFANVALQADAHETSRQPSVAHLMTARPLVTVEPEATLASAWQMMRAANLRHLPVVVRDQVVGMLSDRDVLAVGNGWLRDCEDAPAMLVADAMSPRVSTIHPDRPASEAAARLLRHRFGTLPVVRGQELRGILTVSDFMHWILARA